MIRRFLLAFALAVAPLAAGAQELVPDADPAAVMRESGIVFPERLANFSRNQVYSLMQGQVSATYLLRGPGAGDFILVDVFVRRADRWPPISPAARPPSSS
jgi:hypothetical protein